MVSINDKAASGYSNSPSSEVQPSQEFGHREPVSQSTVSSVSYLASVIQSYKDKGFSEEVAETAARARRSSTR